jgi:hypothetical protein
MSTLRTAAKGDHMCLTFSSGVLGFYSLFINYKWLTVLVQGTVTATGSDR